MTTVEFQIDRNSLPDHTDAEFYEWLRYKLGQQPISIENPLMDEALDAVYELGFS